MSSDTVRIPGSSRNRPRGDDSVRSLCTSRKYFTARQEPRPPNMPVTHGSAHWRMAVDLGEMYWGLARITLLGEPAVAHRGNTKCLRFAVFTLINEQSAPPPDAIRISDPESWTPEIPDLEVSEILLSTIQFANTGHSLPGLIRLSQAARPTGNTRHPSLKGAAFHGGRSGIRGSGKT